MRPRLRLLLSLLAAAGVLLLSAGCATTHRRADGNRVAIALTVNGTEQPTPEQWANLIAALKPRLAALNMVLVNNLSDADRILRIDFTPDPLSPNTAGNAVFLGWRINPLRALTYVSSPSSSVSSINYSSGLYAYHSSPYGYDRFSDYGHSSYSYSGGTTSAPPSKNQATAPATSGDDSVPGMTPPPRSGAGRFVGVDPDGPAKPGPHPPYPSPRYPASTGGYSSSSSGSSSSYSSSSSSSSSYSSGSSSSYSSSSSSSGGSSSYSGGSSYSGSSSSGASFSGSSGTHETSTQKQN